MTENERERYHEGPKAARRFEDSLNRLLRVSKAELTKREVAYQKERRRSKKRRTSQSR